MLSHAADLHINAAKNHLLAYYRKNSSMHPIVAISGIRNSSLQIQLIADVESVQNARNNYDVEHSIYIHALSASKVTDLTLLVNHETEYFTGKSDTVAVKKDTQTKTKAGKEVKEVKEPKQSKVKDVGTVTKKPSKEASPKEPPAKSSTSSKTSTASKPAAKPTAKPAKPTNKRRVIESDDDEDLIISSPAEAPPPAQTRTQDVKKTSKKRKVTKSVTRMNEKGYIVTEDVDEWVSDDGGDGEVEDAKPAPAPVKKTSSLPKPASKAVPAKSKGQSSLNSFFMKKQ
ncbi:hypothetical protein E3P99_03660 [Wallemia hederae]|uniref:DNA polymerase delta subunit 3 n=1 Tax=Wallemia hederae TaxID=1540922 RepID=A0A4T0FEH6_9BASI|nr:hypothetical protein E3P99_03660 [Wallemia hederae]